MSGVRLVDAVVTVVDTPAPCDARVALSPDDTDGEPEGVARAGRAYGSILSPRLVPTCGVDT